MQYPSISDRLKAIAFDYIIMVILMFIIVGIFDRQELVSENTRMFSFLFIFFIYDPLLTSILGGTIGHYTMGIRVKRESNEQKNIFIVLAFIRNIIKLLLGWLSWITASGNSKGRTIHDIIAGSVVVYAKPKDSNKTNPNVIDDEPEEGNLI